MANDHKVAHQALARALLRLPGEVQPSRAIAKAVGDKLAPLVQQAVRSDLGKLSMSGWPDKGEASAFAVVLGGKRATEFGTARTGGVMIIRDRRSAGLVRVLDRGRNMGEKGRRGVVGGLAQGPGVNQATGMTARTKSGGLRKVKDTTRGGYGTTSKHWNGYTKAERTWEDALKLMRAAAPGAVNEIVAADLADKVRKVVLGG